MDEISNKRKNKRFDCCAPVDSSKNGAFGDSLTIDIGKGGIGFVSPRQIPVHQKIAVQLEFDVNGEPVLAIGEVKWVKPIPQTGQYRVGMAFSEIMSGSKSRLNQYFRGHDPKKAVASPF